ncbi:MAG: spore germination protein [Bacillota bacterium]|nr:spore germination protein [Bacillota bacterium]
MATFKSIFKSFVLFKEPKKAETYILKETENEGVKNESIDNEKPRKNEALLLDKDKDKEKKNEGEDTEKSDISKKLSENLEYIKKRFSVPINGDVVIREFDIIIKDKAVPAFLFFYDGLVDRKVVNDDVLQPLMLLSNLDIKGNEKDIASFVKDHLIPHNQLKVEKQMEKVIDMVNFGGCGLFVDGCDVAFSLDVKGWEHRGVERPNTELVIRGPQEGFNEISRVNTALIRKRLKDEDLIVQDIEIGRRSKTPTSLLYIKDIANDSLVREVRRRLKSLKVDYISDTGELEQLIEDSTFLPAPQMLATERPDRVATLLTEGKVAVVMNGSPFVLVMPVTSHELVYSAEDEYVRFPYSNLLRFIRIMGVLLSLLLPGLYVAITTFHHEMIPTSLLLAVVSAREKVPFPSVVEILVMELSFELIREAGIRIPGPIGPTLGIIGALILGQAAVAASIISPILIIIVAVTGLGSFAMPDFALGYAFRLLRFGYILLGAAAGFLGIATGIFIQGIWFASAKSFGVPYMTPLGPKTTTKWYNEIFKAPIWQQEKRPDYLNTKAQKKQPNISRRWTIQKDGEGDENEE